MNCKAWCCSHNQMRSAGIKITLSNFPIMCTFRVGTHQTKQLKLLWLTRQNCGQLSSRRRNKNSCEYRKNGNLFEWSIATLVRQRWQQRNNASCISHYLNWEYAVAYGLGWGIALQARKLRVLLFTVGVLGYFIRLILPTALCVLSSTQPLKEMRIANISWD